MNLGDVFYTYYGSRLFKSICLKRREREIDGESEYYIHYKNWSNKWNEWVDEDDILNINEYNTKHKENLDKL